MLEKVLPSARSSFVAFERVDPEFPFLWHYHPEYELTLIVDSQGQRLVGDGIADYGPGDLVLLGPHLPHSWRSGPEQSGTQDRHRAVVILFREDFAGPELFRTPEMETVRRLLLRSACGLAFGKTEAGRRVARDLLQLPAADAPQRLLMLLRALVELAGTCEAEVLSSAEVKPIRRVADQQRIDALCGYLNQHYKRELDYARLARRFHMDQTSLCRFFRRATGRTMTTYVNELRVGAAAQMLLHSDLSILEICFRVGFGNYSNFNRQFTRLKGCGPRELRRRLGIEPGGDRSSRRRAEPRLLTIS